MSSTDKNIEFSHSIQSDLENKVRHTKLSVEKLAGTFGIANKNLIKELTELAIVRIARNIAQCEKCPQTGQKPSVKQKFDKIVELYNNQVNLSQRTSESILLQQYSTPAPIAFLAGSYILSGLPEDYWIFEPSAGNGLLTIAFKPEKVFVNEIDDIRLANLKKQGFHAVTNINGTKNFDMESQGYQRDMFDGIITNPPFGSLNFESVYGTGTDRFKISTLDHLMALRALDLMKDNGRAAIIIGGHTRWDDMGRVQAGKNRMFLNYLYRYYLVDDVINIDGHKLYSRQGTAFDVRLILIRGRKEKPEGAAPLNSSFNSPVVTDFERLYYRVIVNPEERYKSDHEIIDAFKKNKDEEEFEFAKAKMRVLAMKLKVQNLTGIEDFQIIGEINKDTANSIRRQAGKIIYTELSIQHTIYNHEKELSQIGITALDFIKFIAQNYNEIRQGIGKSLILGVQNTIPKIACIELEQIDNGEYYRIKSAFPANHRYYDKKKLLWQRSAPFGSVSTPGTKLPLKVAIKTWATSAAANTKAILNTKLQ